MKAALYYLLSYLLERPACTITCITALVQQASMPAPNEDSGGLFCCPTAAPGSPVKCPEHEERTFLYDISPPYAQSCCSLPALSGHVPSSEEEFEDPDSLLLFSHAVALKQLWDQ